MARKRVVTEKGLRENPPRTGGTCPELAPPPLPKQPFMLLRQEDESEMREGDKKRGRREISLTNEEERGKGWRRREGKGGKARSIVEKKGGKGEREVVL